MGNYYQPAKNHLATTTSTQYYLSMWFLNDASGYGSIFIDDCSPREDAIDKIELLNSGTRLWKRQSTYLKFFSLDLIEQLFGAVVETKEKM